MEAVSPVPACGSSLPITTNPQDDVYRFGGYEFIGAAEDEARKREMLDNIKKFYIRLFRKYGIDVDS